MLLVFQPDASDSPDSSIPRHGAHGPGHVAFAVADRDISGWIDLLECKGVAIEKTIAWPQGGHSVYFRDPAGNSLEVASPLIWHIDESAVADP